jgi:glutathione S-transferase
MTPKIHLFLSPGACSLAPHILLNEADLPFAFTKIDLSTGFPKEYLHLNPKGQVPFLHLDAETVTELAAIMTAIAQLVPSKHFLGKTPLETVRCYEWLNWMSTSLHSRGYGGVFRPYLYVDDEALYEKVREKSLRRVGECYDFIEEKLEGKKWAVGNDYTAVDAGLFVFHRWGTRSGFEMEKYPNYTRLVKEVAKRPAVIKSMEEEGISISSD